MTTNLTLADAPGSLAEHAGHLGVLLAQWEYRNEARDGAAAIRAGGEAVAVMDRMLRELYDARAALVAERRRDADERVARVDAMLAAARGVPQ